MPAHYLVSENSQRLQKQFVLEDRKKSSQWNGRSQSPQKACEKNLSVYQNNPLDVQGFLSYRNDTETSILHLNAGVLEYWSTGVVDDKSEIMFLSFKPIIPSLQYSKLGRSPRFGRSP